MVASSDKTWWSWPSDWVVPWETELEAATLFYPEEWDDPYTKVDAPLDLEETPKGEMVNVHSS